MSKVVIVGGGAAGMFASIAAAEWRIARKTPFRIFLISLLYETGLFFMLSVIVKYLHSYIISALP